MNRGVQYFPRSRQPIEERIANRLSDTPILASFVAPLLNTQQMWVNAGCMIGGAPGTQALTLNRLYAWPHFVSRDMFIDTVSVNVTTQGVSANTVTIGIYENYSPSAAYPGRLRYQSPALDTVASTGAKTTPANQWLLGGNIYWFAVITGTGTAPTIKANSMGSLWNLFGTNSALTVGQPLIQFDLGVYQMPQVCPNAPTFPTSGNAPAVAFRVMSN